MVERPVRAAWIKYYEGGEWWDTEPGGAATVRKPSRDSWGLSVQMQMEMGYHGVANKDAPGIGGRYQGTAEAPMASKCKVEAKLTSLPAE